jgi:proliferating cell nuclear antigen PCNA
MEENGLSYIFKAKTQDAYVIKLLGELLQNNIRNAGFQISKQGIKLTVSDANQHLHIDLNLDSENFSSYVFNRDSMYIGILLNHFHKMLKNIKKKDSLTLFIRADKPQELGISVKPKENNRQTTSFIKLLHMQVVHFQLPSGYGKPVIVHSPEFQKTVKDLNNIGKEIKIISKGSKIKFFCDAGNIYSREIVFGENDEDEDFEDEEYNQDFDTDILSKISKISGLSSNIQIYTKRNLPILFKSSVGNLGKISIYIKSKEQIAKQDLTAKEIEKEDSDEEE